MDFQDRFFLANEFFTGRFTGPVTFFSYFLCGFNLGSNQFLQNLLTRTKLTYPIAPPLLHFYIDRIGKDKSFADLIKGAWDVHKRFDGNWKKFSKKWPWVGYQILDEKEPWPLLVTFNFWFTF